MIIVANVSICFDRCLLKNTIDVEIDRSKTHYWNDRLPYSRSNSESPQRKPQEYDRAYSIPQPQHIVREACLRQSNTLNSRAVWALPVNLGNHSSSRNNPQNEGHKINILCFVTNSWDYARESILQELSQQITTSWDEYLDNHQDLDYEVLESLLCYPECFNLLSAKTCEIIEDKVDTLIRNDFSTKSALPHIWW